MSDRFVGMEKGLPAQVMLVIDGELGVYCIFKTCEDGSVWIGEARPTAELKTIEEGKLQVIKEITDEGHARNGS